MAMRGGAGRGGSQTPQPLSSPSKPNPPSITPELVWSCDGLSPPPKDRTQRRPSWLVALLFPSLLLLSCEQGFSQGEGQLKAQRGGSSLAACWEPASGFSPPPPPTRTPSSPIDLLSMTSKGPCNLPSTPAEAHSLAEVNRQMQWGCFVSLSASSNFVPSSHRCASQGPRGHGDGDVGVPDRQSSGEVGPGRPVPLPQLPPPGWADPVLSQTQRALNLQPGTPSALRKHA